MASAILVINGPGDGLSPDRREDISWINNALFTIKPSDTKKSVKFESKYMYNDFLI